MADKSLDSVDRAMERSDDGGAAFPRPATVADAERHYIEERAQEGMSLRDYFAAKALPEIMRGADSQTTLAWPDWCRKCARTSYDVADAMLAERKR